MPRFFGNIPWYRKLFGKGANSDVRPELLPDGIYRDAQNMRVRSVDGNTGAAEAVKGEVLQFPATPGVNNLNYRLIGSVEVNGKVVSFWASTNANEAPYVIIDGVVTAHSPAIPYLWDKPLQMAVAEKCRGGIVYATDNNSPPLYWDVRDMLDSRTSGSGAYFDGYNPRRYSAQVLFSPEWPRFRGLLALGNGATTGQHQFYLRAVTPLGDITNPGPESPLIPVPEVSDQDFSIFNSTYPGGRTTGGVANRAVATPYHIRLEFRLDNALGYSEYQVCCRSFDNGEGLNGPGVDRIVARIKVPAGSFDNEPREFVFPRDANESNANDSNIIPPDEVVDQQIYIQRAKAVEYADNRLSFGNFHTISRAMNLVFRTIEGFKLFPFTKRLTTVSATGEENSGYNDPVNAVYRKSHTRGEQVGIYVAGFDGAAGKMFGTEVGIIDLPNRRDIKGSSGRYGNVSDAYSSDRIPAANVDCQGPEPVTPTFEALEQGTRKKTNLTPVVQVNVVPGQSQFYQPYRPVGPTDGNPAGWNIPPIVKRLPVFDTTNPQPNDTGNIWGPRYHALGVGISGIEPNSIPSEVQVLSAARTPVAGRVICQGIGMYDLVEDPSDFRSVGRKSTSRILFWSRDIDSGVVPQSLWDDVVNNPTKYALQAVSPLGMYTEPYGWDRRTGINWGTSANAIDILLYAGIQHDEGQVNVGEPTAGGMGYQPGLNNLTQFNGNWFGYAKGRQSDIPSGIPNGQPGYDPNTYSWWHEAGNDGNTPLQLANNGVTRVIRGRSACWSIQTDNYIYSPNTDRTNGDRGFNDATVRRFHQPLYVFNIVLLEATVRTQNIQQLIPTGDHLKVDATLCITSADPVQTYRLCNERYDDVRGRFPTDFAYLWVNTPGQPEKAWLCVSNNSQINPAQILADIQNNGFWTAPDGTQVYGVYEAFDDFSGQYVRFGAFGLGVPVPPADSRVNVKYNGSAIEVFGGDSTITPAVAAFCDGTYNGSLDFNMSGGINIGGLPLPYPGFIKNIAYKLPESGSLLQTLNGVERMLAIRQLAVMFDTESRTPGNMGLFSLPLNCSFPRQHYKVRPYRFDATQNAAGNGFFAEYDTDYSNEVQWWAFGGFPCENLHDPIGKNNLDYAKSPLVTFFGIPRNGFTEQTDFCTALITSLLRDPLAQDIPGLRTFLSSGVRALSEETGEVKYMASLAQGGRRNMYVLTQSGLWMVLTDKSELTDKDGNLIGTQGIDKYWGSPILLDRAIGCPDEFWQLVARGSMPTGQGYAEGFTWPDRKGWYRLVGNTILPIARDKYWTELKPVVTNLPTGNIERTSAFWNKKQEEVWNNVGGRVYVYSPLLNEWTGQYTYAFDGYTTQGDRVVGHRNLETWLLDEGYTIGGNAREAWIETPIFADFGKFKEAMRWRVFGDKPDYVEVYDQDRNLMSRMDQSVGGDGWAKLYDGWEGYVYRMLASVSSTRTLPQDMGFYIRIGYTTFGEKRITDVEMQVKNIL